MTRQGANRWRAWADSEAVRFSLFSLSSRTEGESGRRRENQIAILPPATYSFDNNLQHVRENRENSSQLHTCAGAARGNSELYTAGAPPESPHSPQAAHSEALWTALVNKEDVYAIAYRLTLPPGDPVDAWRLTALRVAKSEAFMLAKPSHVPLRHADWQRWRSMRESPRKMLDLLRKLVYGVRIWD